MGRSRLTAVANQYVRMLMDQTDGRFVIISGLIAADFRLPAGDLGSRNREQRIAFVRQLARSLSPKITGAPFKLIGAHFHRDHSTVIHAYRLIESRIQRDTAFRLFIKQLEARIIALVFITIPIG
jgi:chromosomal replication initiation ATPase DnaA